MRHLLLEMGFDTEEAPTTTRLGPTVRVELVKVPFYAAREEGGARPADPRVEADAPPVTLRSRVAPDPESGTRLVASAEDARPKPARSPRVSMVVPAGRESRRGKRSRKRADAA